MGKKLDPVYSILIICLVFLGLFFVLKRNQAKKPSREPEGMQGSYETEDKSHSQVVSFATSLDTSSSLKTLSSQPSAKIHEDKEAGN